MRSRASAAAPPPYDSWTTSSSSSVSAWSGFQRARNHRQCEWGWAGRCRSRIFPPGNPFPPEEIYGLYDSKSLPPRKDFLGKISPPPSFPGKKRFTGLKCNFQVQVDLTIYHSQLHRDMYQLSAEQTLTHSHVTRSTPLPSPPSLQYPFVWVLFKEYCGICIRESLSRCNHVWSIGSLPIMTDKKCNIFKCLERTTSVC